MVTVKIAFDGEVLNFLVYEAYKFSFQSLQQLIQQSFDHKLKGNKFEIYWKSEELSSSQHQLCITNEVDLSIVMNSIKPHESLLFFVYIVNDSTAMISPTTSPKSVLSSSQYKSFPDNNNTIYSNLCKVNHYCYSTLWKKNVFSFDEEDVFQQKRPRLYKSISTSMSGAEEEGEDSIYQCVVASKSPKESHSMDYWDDLPPSLTATIAATVPSPAILPYPSKASDHFQSSLDICFEEFALPPPIPVSPPVPSSSAVLEEAGPYFTYPSSEFDDDYEGSHFDDDLPIIPFDHADMLYEDNMGNDSDYSDDEEDDEDADDEIQLMMEHDHYYVDDSIPMLSNLSHHHEHIQNFVM